ncbi:beta-tubulin 2 [Lactarius deliciosus]|nr:beta-tubulin 2 [Lactarius deliciosus]
MPREIINIQAGNQIGENFWKMLLAEHGLDQSGAYHGTDPLQLARVETYFSEVNAGSVAKYVPRSVQIDLEAGVCDRDTFIAGEGGAGNNWAKGCAELVDNITDVLRKQSEPCDALQGFQIIPLSRRRLLLSKLREEYPDRILATFSILPSPKVSETVVEPYNALLSVHQLVENSDMTICIDNEALYDITTRALKVKSPTFDDLNSLVSQVMCGVSTSLRFPGQLNGSVVVITLGALHFLAPSYAPFYDPKAQSFHRISVPDLTSAYVPSHRLISILSQSWIPDNVSVTLCSVPPVGQKQSATCLANTTAIQELFTRNLSQFTAMYKRKAFVHWYTEEGMDTMDNTHDLVNEYQQVWLVNHFVPVDLLTTPYLQYQEATADTEDVEYEHVSEIDQSVGD